MPPGLASGDSKLQLPSVKGVRTEVKEVDGKKYTYMAFTTQTTTLSGYDVKRKHLAVVGEVSALFALAGGVVPRCPCSIGTPALEDGFA